MPKKTIITLNIDTRILKAVDKLRAKENRSRSNWFENHLQSVFGFNQSQPPATPGAAGPVP